MLVQSPMPGSTGLLQYPDHAPVRRADLQDGADAMTGGQTTIVAGIEIPSADPVFLAIVLGVHIPLGIASVVIGAMAMLSRKRRGRHSRFGTIYFWCLLALCASSTLLSLMRWSENHHLLVLGVLSFACALIGREALRQRWRFWIRLHIAGMGLSYVVMLIAFYVDNGKQLPLWKDMPHFMYWLVPLAVGIPLIVRALLWPPLAQERSGIST
jgi:hypothetical protein